VLRWEVTDKRRGILAGTPDFHLKPLGNKSSDDKKPLTAFGTNSDTNNEMVIKSESYDVTSAIQEGT
jgi:hypothetical protein